MSHDKLTGVEWFDVGLSFQSGVTNEERSLLPPGERACHFNFPTLYLD